MTVEGINTIGVLGAGQMGGGIAQVAAQAGYTVILSDISEERSEAGKAKIAKFLARAVTKGRVEQVTRTRRWGASPPWAAWRHSRRPSWSSKRRLRTWTSS